MIKIDKPTEEKKQKVLLFYKEGNLIKWGIEWKERDYRGFLHDVFHKGEKVAKLEFCEVEKPSLRSGYSYKVLELDEQELEELKKLSPNEKKEKQEYEAIVKEEDKIVSNFTKARRNK